jgi:hypothetical protein
MTKYKQAGLSMSLFLMWCVLFACGALLAFKLGPAYFDNMTIAKHFRAMAKDSSFASGNRKEIEQAYSKRSEIDRIDAISPKDIVVTKEGGGITLSASYSKCVPLFYNLSACMDFSPSSK